MQAAINARNLLYRVTGRSVSTGALYVPYAGHVTTTENVTQITFKMIPTPRVMVHHLDALSMTIREEVDDDVRDRIINAYLFHPMARSEENWTPSPDVGHVIEWAPGGGDTYLDVYPPLQYTHGDGGDV